MNGAGIRLSSLSLVVALASTAYGQGAGSKAAYDRLLPLSASPRFAASVASEAAALDSLDDAAWLSGALAEAAKDPMEKKALLSERASLLELLGRYGEAAAAWEAAAAILPGMADASCLLSAAACRLSAGEGEAAARLATAASYASPDPVTAGLAGLILGWAALADGNSAEALAIAKASVADRDARLAVPALLLARASSDGPERAGFERSLSAYASRPEASSSPPMLLIAGSTRTGASLETVPAPPETSARSVASGSGVAASATFYQVGAFRDEANARALARKIEALGLRPVVKKKDGKDLFIVYVGGGDDDTAIVLTLKDAGYEAWVMDSEP